MKGVINETLNKRKYFKESSRYYRQFKVLDYLKKQLFISDFVVILIDRCCRQKQ